MNLDEMPDLMVAESVRPCQFKGCPKPRDSADWCGMHRMRIHRHGDPSATPRFNRDPAVRFWKSVEVGHPAGCWWWVGKINNRGYGLFRTGSGSKGTDRAHVAHRYAYELLIGPIADEAQLDHLCRNPPCVNPDHLEPVTPAENSRRRSSAKRTHCRHGHRYTPETTYRTPSNGRRSCMTCRRVFGRKRRPGVGLGPVSA